MSVIVNFLLAVELHLFLVVIIDILGGSYSGAAVWTVTAILLSVILYVDTVVLVRPVDRVKKAIEPAAAASCAVRVLHVSRRGKAMKPAAAAEQEASQSQVLAQLRCFCQLESTQQHFLGLPKEQQHVLQAVLSKYLKKFPPHKDKLYDTINETTILTKKKEKLEACKDFLSMWERNTFKEWNNEDRDYFALCVIRGTMNLQATLYEQGEKVKGTTLPVLLDLAMTKHFNF
jgi:hypothetical protein